MASEAKTGSAIFFSSRVWCSSDVAIGEPTRTRFNAEYIHGTLAQAPPPGVAEGPG